MRRGVWVVLGLVGVAPVGALAQESRERPARQARAPEEVSQEALQQQIAELWQGFRLLQQEVAALRQEIAGRQEAPAVGGSGQAGTATGGSGRERGGAARAEVPAADVFLGRVSSVAGGRLLMEDRQRRVFEFDLTRQTRVMGPGGAPVSFRALREGTPVRVVTRDGDVRDQVVSLQVLEPAPRPSR